MDVDQRRWQFLGTWEVKGNAAILDHRDGRAHFFKHFDTALRLFGLAGLGTEAVDEGLQMLLLGDLLFIMLGGQFHLFAACLGEFVVVAAIQGDGAVMQMGNRFDHPVEKIAIVTDQDDRAGIVDQIVFKPDGGFKIKVVGRLIKQQQIRAQEKRCGKGHTHTPAAREIITGALLGFAVKTKAGQNGGCPGLGGMGVDVGQACMDFGDAVRVGGGFGLCQQIGAFGIGRQHGFKQGSRTCRGFLRYHTHAGPLGEDNIAAIAGQVARDQFEKGRFPRAIAPDQADLVAIGDGRRYPVKNHTSANAIGEVGNLQHFWLVS